MQAPGGRHYRLGPDEPLPANVPSGLRYSDTMPGGFETADCTLPRQPGVEYPDLERLSNWRVLGAGGEVCWEGRLERAPRTSGDEVSVSPSAVGHQAALDDDKSALAIYRDIDLSRFGPAARERRIDLYGASTPPTDPTTISDLSSGLPALELGIDFPQAAPYKPTGEALYVAPVDIATCYFDYVLSASGGSYFFRVGLASDDIGTGFVDTGNLAGSGTGTFVVGSAGSGHRVVFIDWWYNATPAGVDGQRETAQVRRLAVYGDHGLTKRGTEPNAGFYASDIVAHAVQTFAPSLQVKSDSVQQSSFIIPQLAFLEPTTAAEIVRQASRFNLPDWAVWDDKEFVWHAPGARGRTWRLRIGPSQLEETGPQVDRLWESVIVSYQDVDGSTRTVGPPGSGADTESSDLKDSDPENPANKLGIIRRDLLSMGTSTAAGATEVGRRFLEQSKLLDRSGKARVVGWAEDDRGVLHPFSAIRSGDYCVFVDASDTSARKVIRTDKDYDSRTCTLDLDAPPEGLQQLLERLGVVLTPLGL